MERIKPPALRNGQEIRIVSPSSSADMVNLSRGINRLKALGYRISLGNATKAAYRNQELTVSAEERAKELMDAFTDPDVGAVYCSTGGHAAIHVLDLLDYDQIRDHPKIFVGYSDITALHLAINKQSNMITFHGPMLTSDLDIVYGSEFTHFMGMLEGKTSTLNFRGEDRLMRTIGKGKVEGISMGTNLTVASSLFSTEFMPDPEGRIFFLEDTGVTYREIDRIFFNIEHTTLRSVAGYVFGQFRGVSGSNDPQVFISNMIRDFAFRIKKLSVLEAPFGHGIEQMLIPLNARVSISSEEPHMELKESPVD